MAKQLNVDLSIKADTSQAKNALNELGSALRKIQTMPSSLFDDTDLKAASKAASELQGHLQKAVNTDTGKLDLSRFSQSLASSNQSLEYYYNTLLKIGPTGEKAFLALSKSIAVADTATLKMNSKMREFATTLKNTARWQISSSVLHGFLGTLQSAYGYAQDLNESLNNIRIVTGASEEEMDKFAAKANKAAKALSTSTVAYTDAALIFYQQGLNDSQVEERTNVTIKMAHAAGESATEVSSYMTAIWNNFADGSKELEYYGDVMARLGAETAASSAEIAEGLEKFAAIGETVGLSYEYAAAAVATVVDKTRQSADTVGTAFKTIFARLQGLKLGESLDDGTTLNKYSQALQSVGISIKDTNGQLKDANVILDELGKKWQTLERDEQSALAQTVAGTRQYTQLMALMNNYTDFKSNILLAETSEGTLNEQADIYAQSWEAAQKRVRAAAEEIYAQLLNDDFFIGLLAGFEKVLGGVSNLIDGLGGLKGILMIVGSIFLKNYAKEMPDALRNLVANFGLVTGAAEKNAQAVQKQNQALLDSMVKAGKQDGFSSHSMEAQVSSLSMVNKMTSELTEKQFMLSQSEIELYQNKIQTIATIGQEIALEGQRLDATEKAIEKSKEELAAKNASGEGGFKAKQKEIQAINEQLNALQEVIGEFVKLEISLDDIETQSKMWSKSATDIKKNSKSTQEAAKATQDLKNKMSAYAKQLKDIASPRSLEELEKELKEAGDDSEKALAAWNKFKDGLKVQGDLGLSDLADNIDQIYDKLQRMGIDITSEAFRKLENEFRQGAIDAETFKNKLEALKQSTQDPITHTAKLSEAIGTFGSTVMQVGTMIGSIKSLFTIWNNDDLTTGEKLLQSITAVGMALTTFTAIANKKNLVQLAGASASIASAFGLGTEATAAMGAAAATGTFSASLWTLLWPIGLVMAAIAALVAVIYGLVKAFQWIASQTPEGQLKALEERANKSAEAFDRVSDAVEAVNTKLDELESAYDTIDKLTKGTSDWYKAVSDVNYEVSQLLEKYPQLKDYVYQEDGLLKISNGGFDYVRELENNRLQTANNIKLNDVKAVNDQKIENAWYDSSFYDKDMWNMVTGLYQNEKIGESLFGDTRAWAEEIVNSSYGTKEDYANREKEAYGEYEGYQEYAESMWESEVQYMETLLQENEDLIKDVGQLSENNRQLDNAQFEAKLAAIGSLRTAEQGRELLGVDGYSGIVEASRQKVSDSFGDWNDHINYSEDDEEWKDIQKFMDLKGDNVKYVAQQWGKMVLEIDGEEVKFSKDEVYDALAELYSTDELKNRMATELEKTLGAAVPNVEFQGLDVDTLINLDNLHLQLKEALSGIGDDVNVDGIFQAIVENAGASEEELRQFSDTISSIDFSNVENLRTFTGEAQKLEQGLKDGTYSVEDFTYAMEKLAAASDLASMGDFFNGEASKMGLGEEEAKVMQEYAKNLMEASEETEGLSKELATSADSAADLAVEVTRMNKGIDKLADGFEDWSDVLKKSSKTSYEYAEAMMGMKDALSDVLDVESDLISSDFVEEHLEEIEKAAEGDEDAIDSLRAAMDEEIIANITLGQTDEFIEKVNSLNNEVQRIANEIPDIEVGAILQDAAFLEAANNLVSEAGMTADEANAYFAGIGYEPVYSTTDVENAQSLDVPNASTTLSVDHIGWTDVPVDLPDWFPGDHNITLPSITYSSKPATSAPDVAEADMRLTSFSGDGKPPEIKGLRKKASGSMNNYSSSNSGGKKPGSSGGKGGGGGSNKKPKSRVKADAGAKKVLEEEAERYHEITNSLESLGYELDRVAEAKDRAFGKDKLKYMDEEADLLQKQIKLQKQYQNEIKQNAVNDYNRVHNKYGINVNEDGDIVNYDEIMQRQINAYNAAYDKYIKDQNAAVDAYNKSGMEDADEEAYDNRIDAAKAEWEAAQKEYEQFISDMEQYEDSVDLFKESEATLRQIQNQLYDLKLEKIDYQVELQIDVEEDSMKVLDFLLGNLEDNAHDAAEAISILTQQTESAMNNLATYEKGINDLFANHGLGKNAINQFLNGTLTADDLANMDFTEAEVEKLREYRDGLLEETQNLIDYENAIREKVLTAWDDLVSKMDQGIEKLDHLTSMTQSFKNIVDIVGKDMLGISDELMKSLDQAAYDTALNKLEATSSKLDAMRASRQEAEDALAQARLEGNEDLIQYWEETIATMDSEIDAAEEEFMSSWEESLQAAADMFANETEAIINEFSEKMAGAFGGTLEELQNAFSKQREINDLYVDDYKKIYELSKLSRDISKSVDETDNLAGKKALLAIQEEINKAQAEGVEMSEYEIENLRRKYDLELAKMQLDEAKNTKSTVRMTRDNNGNWGYVYTADQDGVAAAEQNYEDKLYAMQEANSEYIKELEANIIQAEINMTEAMREIDATQYANAEEYYKACEEVAKPYYKMMEFYTNQMNLALGNNKQLYNGDWKEYSISTGYKISANEDFMDSFSETLLGQMTGYRSAEGYLQAHIEAVGSVDNPESLLGKLGTAYNGYSAKVDTAMEAAGTSTKNFAEHLDGYVNDEENGIAANAEKASSSVEQAGKDMKNSMDTVIRDVTNFSSKYGSKIQSIISKNTKLANSLNSVIAKWSELNGEENGSGTTNTTPTTTPTTPTTKPTTTPTTPSTPKNTNNNSGSGDGVLSVGDTVTYTGGKYYADSYGGGASGSRGPGKQVTVTDIRNGRPYPIHVQSSNSAYGWLKKSQLSGFDTGGYTGVWGDQMGRLALLHQKELVLNENETKDMLQMIEMVREISSMIDLNAMSASQGLTGYLSSGRFNDGMMTIQQEVTIHAEFPDVSDRNEIKEAFGDLINMAAQYANRIK